MKHEEQMTEINQDVDELMTKILNRLESQSDIIGTWTRLRVAKMFIQQVAEGGNKVFLSNEYNKIKKKVEALPKVAD